MNIAIDIRPLMTPVRTGVGEYTYELLDAVFRLDHNNHYFLFTNAAGDALKYVPTWKQENVHYAVTRWPNKLLSSSLYLVDRPRLDNLTFRHCIRNLKLEIKNLDAWFSPNLNFTTLSDSTKYILTIHDLSFEHFPDCYSWKRRRWHQAVNAGQQCERADIILTPSENTKRDVIETYQINSDKVRVLRPGLADNFRFQISDLRLSEVRAKYNLPDKFILFLGTIEPRKNIIGLIDAFCYFKKHYELLASGYELVIAGPLGWKYTPIILTIEQTPGVRYIGYVAATDKPALYRLASLFAYPSLYEGFGFPVLEAMASGTPVITSCRSSLPEVADDAAVLINPWNTFELADQMYAVLGDDKKRVWLCRQGRLRAELFSWEKTAATLQNFLCVL